MFVCLIPGFDYAELKRYDDLPKQTWAIFDPAHSARVILAPLFSLFGPILRFSGSSWVSVAPSSGHLDPLTIPLSFFRESKTVLASTIIFIEDTSYYKRNHRHKNADEYVCSRIFNSLDCSMHILMTGCDW